MIENTIENKGKFFAQYWGQKVFKVWNVTTSVKFKGQSSGFIELKSLSSITDEDAISVWDLLNPDGGNKKHLDKREIIEQGKNIAKSLQYSNSGWMVGLSCVIACYQYLRSKGYALPYMGLSVEKQIEYGWIKLAE